MMKYSKYNCVNGHWIFSNNSFTALDLFTEL
jgi:hypothetical protein